MGKKLTKQEFIDRSIKLYGDKYSYENVELINTSTKVIITCKEHGDFSTTPHNFLAGHGCPTCSSRERINQNVFINRSKIKHNNRYDYSKVKYINLNTPVEISCPIHGSFFQKPSVHMSGCGCQKCFATPKSNTNEFIEKAKKIYGNKYDYSKVIYNGNKEKVTIICPKHGEWQVTPNNFLRGSECPACFGTPKHTNDEFITKAKSIHGNKYDYSKVLYDGNKKNVTIICPIHGEFLQTPSSHLKGNGCKKCSGNYKIDKNEFVSRSIKAHKNKYDYSKVEFQKSTEKVCITCPTHGDFWQNAQFHMRGGNCPKCVGGKKITTEEFISKANKIHKNKYDYSKVVYKNTSTKVCITCPTHGDFWQTPNNHLFGAGCPTCPQSNLEGEMREFLIKNNIVFIQEQSFDWLKYKKKLFLDFYLPELNIAIECQGGQHFKAVDIFGGEEFYQKTIERDLIKQELCKEHGIKIIYFSNAHIDYPYEVIESYAYLKDILNKHAVTRYIK